MFIIVPDNGVWVRALTSDGMYIYTYLLTHKQTHMQPHTCVIIIIIIIIISKHLYSARSRKPFLDTSHNKYTGK